MRKTNEILFVTASSAHFSTLILPFFRPPSPLFSGKYNNSQPVADWYIYTYNSFFSLIFCIRTDYLYLCSRNG